MTLNQIVTLAGDGAFQGQCRAAALNYALVVIAEVPVNPQRIAQKRFTFAQQVLANGCSESNLIARISWGLAAVPGFVAIPQDNGQANDAALESAIQTQWNNLAGVTGQDVLNN